MNKTMPMLQYLARRLIAIESSRDPSAGSGDATMRACEKLQVPLAKLMGVAGFHSVLSRALAMAKVEAPSLGAVQLRPDGLLEGLDKTGVDQEAEAGVVVMAHLLGLLVTFIGEPLTLGIVRGAWPDEPLDQTDQRAEGES